MSKHTPATTATRTRKGAKSVITVTMPDGSTITAGGKRAERAQAVIITRYPHQPTAGLYGVRADLAAATTEALKLRTATTTRHHGVTLACTPADEAYAVPVVDAPEAPATPAATKRAKADAALVAKVVAIDAAKAHEAKVSRRTVAPGSADADALNEALHAARIAGEEARAAAERREAAIVAAVDAGATFKDAGHAAGVSHEQARLVYVRWMRTATAR